MSSQRTYTPSRLLILAFPAGIYTTMRLGLDEWEWEHAVLLGLLTALLVRFGPAVIRTTAKATAVHTATKKKAKKEGEK